MLRLDANVFKECVAGSLLPVVLSHSSWLTSWQIGVHYLPSCIREGMASTTICMSACRKKNTWRLSANTYVGYRRVPYCKFTAAGTNDGEQ
jgi:hypothetical protein